jgi:hypothetical protein
MFRKHAPGFTLGPSGKLATLSDPRLIFAVLYLGLIIGLLLQYCMAYAEHYARGYPAGLIIQPKQM